MSTAARADGPQIRLAGLPALRRETYERAAIGAITALLLLLLPERYFLLAFIVLGQGHFLMTYLYQWKGKKIGPRYLALYVLALSALAYLVTYAVSLPVVLFVTGSVFALHFFYDEARLYARDNGISLGIVWYPALLFLLVLVEYLFAFDVLPFVVAGTLLLILQCARGQGKERSHPSTRRYMGAFSAILLVALVAPVSIPATSLLGAIILYHYMSWYVHYFFRLKDASRPVRPYLKNAIAVNAVVIGAFAAYLLFVPARGALGFVFEEKYFYMWTLLHIFFASNEFLVALRGQVLARVLNRA